MVAYVIKLQGGLMLAPWPMEPGHRVANGWRPFVWTKDLAKAEKFDTAAEADAFARAALPHLLFDVSTVVGAGPGPDDGGTPIEMREAA